MARIALKIDVDMLRGTREGVLRLLALLGRFGVSAASLFLASSPTTPARR